MAGPQTLRHGIHGSRGPRYLPPICAVGHWRRRSCHLLHQHLVGFGALLCALLLVVVPTGHAYTVRILMLPLAVNCNHESTNDHHDYVFLEMQHPIFAVKELCKKNLIWYTSQTPSTIEVQSTLKSRERLFMKVRPFATSSVTHYHVTCDANVVNQILFIFYSIKF